MCVCCFSWSASWSCSLPPKMAKMVNMAKVTKAAMATWIGDTAPDGISV